LIVMPNSPDAAELIEGAALIVGTINPGATASAGGAKPAASTGPRMPF
jgi:hypothetical protein